MNVIIASVILIFKTMNEIYLSVYSLYTFGIWIPSTASTYLARPDRPLSFKRAHIAASVIGHQMALTNQLYFSISHYICKKTFGIRIKLM